MRTVQFDRAACRWWNLRLAVTTAALSRPALRRTRWTPTLIIVAVFVVSRVVAFAAGVRYDDGLLHNAYQLLDVRLLREQPFSSIFYLQSQPPLFNLFTAAIVQLPDGLVQSALAVIWAVAGLATALLLYATIAARHPPLAGRRRCLAVPDRSGDRSHRELVLLLRAAAPRDRGRAVRAHPIRRRSSYVERGAVRQFARRLGVAAQFVPRRPDGVGARGRVAPALRSRVDRSPPSRWCPSWSSARGRSRTLSSSTAGPTARGSGMNLSFVAHTGVSQADCRRLVADGTVSTSACRVAFRAPPAYTARSHARSTTATLRLIACTNRPVSPTSMPLCTPTSRRNTSTTRSSSSATGAWERSHAPRLAAYTCGRSPVRRLAAAPG